MFHETFFIYLRKSNQIMRKIFQSIRKLMGVSESDQPLDLHFLESEEVQETMDEDTDLSKKLSKLLRQGGFNKDETDPHSSSEGSPD
jgi:hypothetical protein